MEQSIQESILWQDEALLAVNKPAGLLTIRDGYNPNLPYLANLLGQEYGRVWVVHRLDKDTSGVILFARSAEAHKELNRQFEMRETSKIYHALTQGVPDWETLSVSLPLRVNGDRKHRTVIDHQRGKSAETDLQVLQRFSVCALISARPHSGYTHQIRAHLAAVGFSLLADPLYHSLVSHLPSSKLTAVAASLPIQRTALHAYQITFRHPESSELLTLCAKYPQDFQETIESLE